jgi:hypothetical protein
MSQPKTFEQLFQECCDELRAQQPGGSQGGAAVSRSDWAEWLRYLPIPGLVCSLSGAFCGALIAKYMHWDPQKARQAKLQASLDQGLAEMKANRATEPSPELLKVIEEIKSLQGQILTELRGMVPAEDLNSARDAIFAEAARNGARDHEAEEVAELIADKFGKPLVAPRNPGTPPAPPHT